MGLFSLFRKNTFSHGIHPPIYKSQTSQVPIRRLPFPRKLVLPLGQHFGAPSEAIVHKGQEVVRGQPIARATGEMSVPIHAPASGIIKGIELVLTSRGFKEAAIIIEPYEASTQEVLWTEYSDPELMDRDQLLEAIKNLLLQKILLVQILLDDEKTVLSNKPEVMEQMQKKEKLLWLLH